MFFGIVYSLGSWLNSGNMWVSLLAVIVYAVLVVVLITVFDYMFGWAERKIMAKAQSRHGPTKVGKYGILQNLADLIKLIAKSNYAPRNAKKFIFSFTIVLMLAISIFIILLLPFSQSLTVANLGFGLLVIFVALAFMPIIIFINGFASGNKFAAISAERSVVMLVSYEIPLLIIIASVAMLSGSYNLVEIIAAQAATHWYVLLMPIGFATFFIAMLAEFERPPFDIREADSELIAGWLTDVSAPYFSLALFIDYTRMFLGSLVITMLFLGGWSGPGLLPPIFWLLAKSVAIALVIIVIRATMVRMRLDRLLRIGWMALLPLALVNLILTFIIFVK